MVTFATSGWQEAGFDWNRIPGVTSIHLPFDQLRARVLNVDTFSGMEEMLYSDEAFAGGLSQAHLNGNFGMVLHEHDKYNGSHRARKSFHFFDGTIVCLGTDIENLNTEYPTETTVFHAQELINYTDKIYLEFGADPHVEGIYTGEDIKEIRKNAIHAGLKLVDCPIRHLGTEKAQELYLAIQNYLADNGVEMRFNTECENIILEEEGCKGVLLKDGDSLLPVYADEVVIGTGRRGADWLEKLCAEHHIAHKPGTVDIGVRVECRNEVMEKVNKVLYESKLIGYPKPWKNKVRTFCQNPGGFVAQENYDNDLAVVNGHSFKEKKSPNTNLAILVSHNFTEPFNQPIAYAQKVGELTNMLGAGHIMVQRYGDILDGKRTWQKELAQSNVKPTLKDAVAGDITAAMPYRAMTNIIEFIKMLDMVVPGFAANETLLYSPELKFYSNKVKMDENLDTNIKGLHCLGDSSGWTRGLMMASVMGVLMGRKLAEKEGC